MDQGQARKVAKGRLPDASPLTMSFPRKREPLFNGGPRFRGDDTQSCSESRVEP
jgi:hypothetical protein